MISLFTMTICCNPKDCQTKVTIVNNSDKAIYFYVSSRYPDTLNLYPNPVLGDNGNKIREKSTGQDLYGDCYKYMFKNSRSGVIMFFIYDAHTLETTPWDTIVKNYMVLKRYDLKLEDMTRMNWTITYP